MLSENETLHLATFKDRWSTDQTSALQKKLSEVLSNQLHHLERRRF